MPFLEKSELINALRLETEALTLDNGGQVIVSQVGASDYIRLWTDPANRKGDDIDMSLFTPRLVACSIVDDKGERIFADDEITVLQRSNPQIFTKLAEVARRLNGLGGDTVKNSEASPTKDLSSGSQPA